MLKKYLLPTFLTLLCLALLLGGAGLFYTLTQYSPSAKGSSTARVETLWVISLDEAWAQTTFASDDPETQQAAIAQTLTEVQALGGNAIALTARLPDGSTLFVDKTETLTRAESITANDQVFTSYDGLETLITAANAAGIEVLLTPTDESGTAISQPQADTLPDFMQEVIARHALRLLIEDSTLGLQIADLTSGESDTLIATTSDTPIALALTLQQTAATDAAAAQLFLGDYTALCADATELLLFQAYYAEGETLPDLTEYLASDYARTLAVTYPTEDNSAVTSKSLFILGTSDPDSPLSMDGEEIARHGTQGVWGVLVSLSYGTNTFTFENGADTLTYTVRYTGSEGSGSSSSSGGSYYNVSEGQTIIITDDIASALSNAYSASTITQTLYQGAVAEVTRYVSYADSSTPYAYQLTSGDWVRATYCALYDTSRIHLNEAGISYDEEIRGSLLTFSGGTPAVYHLWEDNTLTLTLMTTDYSGSALNSDWFSSTVSIDTAGNTIFTFTFTEDEPLYGWAVTYDTEALTTTITLKQTPHLSVDESLPLTGVRVLLDAGHGLEDLGAMGAGGLDAPCEKDVNLALTMATAYRLEQLGATVILTREDDSFPSLGDRVTALNTIQPDFFLSIHHNSLELVSDLNEATGVEAYWFYDEGEAFATDLITAVSEAADRNLRSANYGYYYVTRSNICPATLLEVGFMTNPWEYESVTDVDTIWAEAGAIAQTIYDTVSANG
ncbi:MAG: N-acetylmuramoyl-L-alanine amidase [Faecalibacterium sp.]